MRLLRYSVGVLMSLLHGEKHTVEGSGDPEINNTKPLKIHWEQKGYKGPCNVQARSDPAPLSVGDKAERSKEPVRSR